MNEVQERVASAAAAITVLSMLLGSVSGAFLGYALLGGMASFVGAFIGVWAGGAGGLALAGWLLDVELGPSDENERS